MTEISPKSNIETAKSQENVFKNVIVKHVLNDRATVAFVGRHPNLPKDLGWTLRGLKTQNELDTKFAHVKTYLFEMAKGFSLTEILSPVSSEQNGLIAEDQLYELDFDLGLNERGEKITLKRGKNVEGTKIEIHQAFFVTPADCLTMVGTNDSGEIVATHAGRNSVLNIEDLFKFGVVENLVKSLGGENVELWAGLGVSSEAYKHSLSDPKYGPANARRAAFLQKLCPDFKCVAGDGLDVYEIVNCICTRLGVKLTLDKDVCTFSDVDENGESIAHSNVRLNEEKSARNGVLVFHKKMD